MERNTQFKCDGDVDAYFAAQIELWSDPKPQPPDDLWERLEQARLFRSTSQPGLFWSSE